MPPSDTPALSPAPLSPFSPVPVASPVLAANQRYQLFSLTSSALPGSRTVTVYLPEAYLLEPDRRFPVFYLHDGQNLFDPTTAYLPGHTWRAHTTADALTARGSTQPVILVGIANAGDERMSEYTPSADPNFGGGKGIQYGQLLLEELKPAIDARFRTLPGPRHTALGGSSLGGLISLFLAARHRDLIGKIAVLSPSIWWNNRSILDLLRSLPHEPELDIWLDMGTAEGARHLRDTDQLFTLLVENGWREGLDLAYLRVAGGVHNEDAWGDRFGDVLAFLLPAERPSLVDLDAPLAEISELR